MAFNTLIELNSKTGGSLLMNKVISLFNNKQIQDLGKNEEKILIDILNFIKYVKEGRKCIVEKQPIKNLSKSLEAFNISLNALDQSEENLTLDYFDQIINQSETHIDNSLKRKRILEEYKDSSEKLFKSIRKFLIKEANKINIEHHSNH